MKPWVAGLCWFIVGVLVAGCEGEGDDGRRQLVSRDLLADGSVRSVYQEPVTTDTGAPAVRTTTILEPAGGTPTTNVTVTLVTGAMNGEMTNSQPASLMPTVPGLPPGAIPLPPAP